MTYGVAVFSSPIHEYLATQNGLRRQTRQLYFGRIGYVAQPKADKRVSTSFARKSSKAPWHSLAPSTEQSVRDYFYFFTQAPPGKRPRLFTKSADAAHSDARRSAAFVQNLSPGA